MTWALLIAMGFSVLGFNSQADCDAAAKAAKIWPANYVCVRVPEGGHVIGRASQGAKQ